MVYNIKKKIVNIFLKSYTNCYIIKQKWKHIPINLLCSFYIKHMISAIMSKNFVMSALTTFICWYHDMVDISNKCYKFWQGFHKINTQLTFSKNNLKIDQNKASWIFQPLYKVQTFMDIQTDTHWVLYSILEISLLFHNNF